METCSTSWTVFTLGQQATTAVFLSVRLGEVRVSRRNKIDGPMDRFSIRDRHLGIIEPFQLTMCSARRVRRSLRGIHLAKQRGRLSKHAAKRESRGLQMSENDDSPERVRPPLAQRGWFATTKQNHMTDVKHARELRSYSAERPQSGRIIAHLCARPHV